MCTPSCKGSDAGVVLLFRSSIHDLSWRPLSEGLIFLFWTVQGRRSVCCVRYMILNQFSRKLHSGERKLPTPSPQNNNNNKKHQNNNNNKTTRNIQRKQPIFLSMSFCLHMTPTPAFSVKFVFDSENKRTTFLKMWEGRRLKKERSYFFALLLFDCFDSVFVQFSSRSTEVNKKVKKGRSWRASSVHLPTVEKLAWSGLKPVNSSC